MDDFEIKQKAAKYENALESRAVNDVKQGLMADVSCHSTNDFNRIMQSWKQMNHERHMSDPSIPSVELVHDVQIGSLGLGNTKQVDANVFGYDQTLIDETSINRERNSSHARLMENAQGSNPIDKYSPVLTDRARNKQSDNKDDGGVLHWARPNR